jgi:hypothetical protein
MSEPGYRSVEEIIHEAERPRTAKELEEIKKAEENSLPELPRKKSEKVVLEPSEEQSSDGFRLNEDTYVNELKEYIGNTYKQHYARKGGKQDIELIMEDGFGLGFCAGNVRKYISRYGKKNGYNRADILKTLHYGIFLLYAHDNEFNEDEEE